MACSLRGRRLVELSSALGHLWPVLGCCHHWIFLSSASPLCSAIGLQQPELGLPPYARRYGELVSSVFDLSHATLSSAEMGRGGELGLHAELAVLMLGLELPYVVRLWELGMPHARLLFVLRCCLDTAGLGGALLDEAELGHALSSSLSSSSVGGREGR
ncbi:hypothetical protein Dimus_009823 [Dionaea muscipula]